MGRKHTPDKYTVLIVKWPHTVNEIMTKPDVKLKENQTEIVSRLELVAEEGADPNISINPSQERLRIGLSTSDDPAEFGPEFVRTETVRSEAINLGGGREFGNEGVVQVNRNGDREKERPVAGVDIKGGGKTSSSEWPAEIVVYDDGQRSLSVGPDYIRMNGGKISGPDRIESTSSLQVGAATDSGGSRDFEKDGDSGSGDEYEYTPGEITVTGDTGTEDEVTTTARIRGAPSDRNGASASFFHETGLRTVDIDAGTGRLALGGHTGDGVTSVASGENGALTLADGAGSYFSVTAKNGTVSIGLAGSGPLFEIDTNDETIRTKYDIEQGVL